MDAHVQGLVAELAQPLDDRAFEREASVVRGHRDAHA
jgi:hypothetical protein